MRFAPKLRILSGVAEDHEHHEHHEHEREADLRARIAYLEAALEPGSEINSRTTFYYGKGESMRQELAELRAQLTKALREDVRRYESDIRDLADDD